MHDNFNSVEDIDNMLDQEFGIDDVETPTDESSQEVETLDEVSTDTDLEVETEDESNQENIEGPNIGTTDQETDAQPESTSKPDSNAKKDYAFAQIRKERDDLKTQLQSANKNETMLKAIASQYGYDNVDEFYKAYEDARIAKEAKDKGYDPELYRQLQESNQRIAQLEQSERERTLLQSAEKFKIAVDKAVVDYNLGENGSTEIFDRLEEAGYNVDTILRLPNPDIVIKGVLADKIVKISEQKQIEKINKLDTIADGRHSDMSADKSFNIDDFIEQDLQDYKANNYFE